MVYFFGVYCLFLTPSPLISKAISQEMGCASGWRQAGWQLVPFPDTHARYLSYQIRIPKGQKLSLKFEGQVPRGRYHSLVVYDQKTENSLSHVLDVQMQKKGTNADEFSQWALSEGVADQSKELRLPFSKTEDRLIDVWYRIYRLQATVVAPQILAFAGDKVVSVKCPALDEKEYSIATVPSFGGKRKPSAYVEEKVPLPPENGEAHFFAPDSGSLGDNPHIRYLSLRLPISAGVGDFWEKIALISKKYIQNIGNTTVLKFKVPTFSETEKGVPLQGNEEVRYWSICLSEYDTSTSQCLADAEAKYYEDERGEKYAVVVFGPNDPRLKEEAFKRGYNFIPRTKLDQQGGEVPVVVPIVFYRQMLAKEDFPGRIDHVKRLPIEIVRKKKDASPYYADRYIGDYSPTGRHCHLEEFLRNHCGVSIP